LKNDILKGSENSSKVIVKKKLHACNLIRTYAHKKKKKSR